jgi:hypothetical protein
MGHLPPMHECILLVPQGRRPVDRSAYAEDLYVCKSHLIMGGVIFESLAQPMHLLIILFVALLLFGPSKVGRSRQRIGRWHPWFRDAPGGKLTKGNWCRGLL